MFWKGCNLISNFEKNIYDITTMSVMNNVDKCDDNNISFAVRVSLYIDGPSHPSTVALYVINASSL